MKIKSVVKVMNFHSILRVDESKRKAENLFGYELLVRDFIDNILNNKNLILDKKMIKMNDDGIDLNIYIANDLGFCGNFNSNINELLKLDEEGDKIIIGKKIAKANRYNNVIFSVTKEEYFNINNEIYEFLIESIKKQKYRTINLLYNHYYKVSKIERVKHTILPLENEENGKSYNEDFVIEGDINSILIDIVALYVLYEMRVAVENSYASENIMRQVITKESLKKIDEMEAIQKLQNLKMKKIKNLKKQLDVINKKRIDD